VRGVAATAVLIAVALAAAPRSPVHVIVKQAGTVNIVQPVTAVRFGVAVESGAPLVVGDALRCEQEVKEETVTFEDGEKGKSNMSYLVCGERRLRIVALGF
jgi:hypothetical protein